MSRFLNAALVALALTVVPAAVPGLPKQAAHAGYTRTYCVYVWDCHCHEWKPVYRSSCYDHAYDAACKWAKKGYKTCIR